MARLAYVLLAIVFWSTATTLARRQSPSDADGLQAEPDTKWVPKDWRAVREKNGCTLAVPREWPPPVSSSFGPKYRQMNVVVWVRPLKESWAQHKADLKRRSAATIEETEDRIWIKWPADPQDVLGYSVHQRLSPTLFCSVGVWIHKVADLPAFRPIAETLLRTVHSEAP